MEIIAAVFNFYFSGRLGKEIGVGGERQSKGGRGVGMGRYNPMFLFCSLLQFDIRTVLFGEKEGNSVLSFGIQAVTVARGICFGSEFQP